LAKFSSLQSRTETRKEKKAKQMAANFYFTKKQNIIFIFRLSFHIFCVFLYLLFNS